MYNKIKALIIASFIIAITALTPCSAEIDKPLKRLEKLGEKGMSGYAMPANPETAIHEVVGSVITAFISLLGVIFLFLALMGGYYYMTARGEEAKVEKSLDTIRWAIIGLVITLGSYAIWKFVEKYLLT